MVNDKAAAAFRVYLSLSDSEKNELVRYINDYVGGTFEKKTALRASVMKVDVGPLSSGGCPYCGK